MPTGEQGGAVAECAGGEACGGIEKYAGEVLSRRRFTEAGGAVSYGPDFPESTQRSAIMVARILDGAKPGDLPIERPAKFEFLLNMKTIRALGLSVPDTLLVRADEVIR